jgi:hypothetical protein
MAKDPGSDKAPDSASKPHTRFHPATFKQKVLVSFWLIAVLVLLFAVWNRCVDAVDHYLRRETRVVWTPSTSVLPKSGPSNFWYDPDRKQLVYVGVIDSKQKFDLLNLLPADAEQKSPDVKTSYQAAIDALAFQSNQGLYGLMAALLSLGGLSGALGAQLRSLTAFIGNACYTGQLDVVTWWPYYLLRPFTGFVLGIVVVVVIQAGFLTVGGGAPSGTLWWVAVAILAGYSDDEFTQKLRQISKAVFGGKDSSSKDSPSKGSDANDAGDAESAEKTAAGNQTG